jgi:hypothetical protein
VMGLAERFPEDEDGPKSAESVSKMATLTTSPMAIDCVAEPPKASRPRRPNRRSEGRPEAERCPEPRKLLSAESTRPSIGTNW